MKFFEGGPSAVEALDHEAKYILPAAAAAAARALLAGVCRPERPHAGSLVETVYFDDAALSSLEQKRASDYLKRKFRLRWYDGGGPVWLEIKRRIGSRREKARLPTGLDGAALGARGLAGLAGLSFVALAAAQGVAVPADLLPTLRLRYQRRRYVDPASGTRLALDTDILAVERAEPWGARALRRLDVALVEVKGGRRELPAALEVLARLGARRGSFSKYAACFAPTSP